MFSWFFGACKFVNIIFNKTERNLTKLIKFGINNNKIRKPKRNLFNKFHKFIHKFHGQVEIISDHFPSKLPNFHHLLNEKL